MAACRNLSLLLWRNCLKRRRAPCSFACELLFPIIIVGLFIGLYQAFSTTVSPQRMYFDQLKSVPTLAGSGYRIQNASQVLALGKQAMSRCGCGGRPGAPWFRVAFFITDV